MSRIRTLDGVAIAAIAWIAIVAIGSLLAPLIAPHDPLAINLGLRNRPPGTADPAGGLGFLLGTDPLGRDILSRLIFGAQVSLAVGTLSVLVSGTFGVLVGLLAGYYRGWFEKILMRVIDVQMSLPPMLIALLLLYTLGGGTLNVVFVLAVTRWPVYARLVRGIMLSLRERQFIEAIVQTGASDARVLIRHAIPNVARPVAVLATLEVATMMLTEAGLDFLGLGVQPPSATWGLMLADGQQYITVAWWQITMPGLAILFTSLAFNLLGTSMGKPSASRPLKPDAGMELAPLRPG